MVLGVPEGFGSRLPLCCFVFHCALCVFAGFSVTSTVCLNPNWELVRCVCIYLCFFESFLYVNVNETQHHRPVLADDS